MGKASRKKRQRREPRSVAIVNPATGLTEIHRIGISDEHLEDWMRDRVRLTGQGYPDRPPDIDTGKFRQWFVRPGEMQDSLQGVKSEGTFAGSQQVKFPDGSERKLLIDQRPDGTYFLRLKSISPVGTVEVRQADAESPQELDTLVAFVTGAWRALGLEVVTHTPADFAQAALEVDRLIA